MAVLGVFGPQIAVAHRRLQRLDGVGAGGEQNPCRASWLMQQVVLVQDYNVAYEILVAERAEKGLDPVKVVVPQLWCLLRTRSEGPLVSASGSVIGRSRPSFSAPGTEADPLSPSMRLSPGPDRIPVRRTGDPPNWPVSRPSFFLSQGSPRPGSKVHDARQAVLYRLLEQSVGSGPDSCSDFEMPLDSQTHKPP